MRVAAGIAQFADIQDVEDEKQVVYECNYCGVELTVTPQIVGERLVLLITPCQSCVARKALLASENEWMRKKTEREAA